MSDHERQDPDGAVLLITERQAAQFCRNALKALRDGATRAEAAQEAIRKVKQNRRGGRCATHAACEPESNTGKEATQ